MKKRLSGCLAVLLLLMVFMLSACGQQKSEAVPEHQVYYLNKDDTKVVGVAYSQEGTDAEELINEYIGALETAPSNVELKAPISGSFAVLDYYLEDGQVVISFDESYKQLDTTTEVLTRAAIVRTLSQIDGVKFVLFKIKDEPLSDLSGNPVGAMNADTFIDNAGKEISTYEKVKLKLYFADADGTGLLGVNQTVIYNSNISLEKLVVEQLIVGPEMGESYPTINPDTGVVSVTVKDGICYVNLDENFLVQVYNISPEVTIYSIANSLVELSNVNKVQISINGDTGGTYRESIPFSTMLERNLDLINSGDS